MVTRILMAILISYLFGGQVEIGLSSELRVEQYLAKAKRKGCQQEGQNLFIRSNYQPLCQVLRGREICRFARPRNGEV